MRSFGHGVAIAGCFLLVGCADSPEGGNRAGGAAAPDAAEFVGREACARCHAEQEERWLGSHHDRAMEVASADAVLGDFSDATFTGADATYTFFRRDAGFWVRTQGQREGLEEFELAYTFGVEPLQQYLVAFPGGRYQALTIAWDSRSPEDGGQRWFDLRAGDEVSPGDPFHWTGANYNWNYMCAECHSTDFQKNYRPSDDTYDSTWAEIDVSCEACHGPGSAHVVWAEDALGANPGGEAGFAASRAAAEGPSSAAGSTPALTEAEMGLVVALREDNDVAWNIDPETGLARRDPPRRSRAQLQVCARCHSRRGVIRDPYEYGRPLTETHRPALLDEGLYYADGQILEEVYVYGSFLQSKMYREGVTCSDCHEPHGLRLNNQGDALCTRCHAAEKFDSADHHRHEVGTEGAQCIGCHMPATTYMVVDPRRDHSFRIPRPDLGERLGAPDACTRCHTDRSATWAAAAIVDWYGPERPEHYGEILYAGRRGGPGAEVALQRLARDFAAPEIVRATALTLLRDIEGSRTLEVIERSISDASPLVRFGALRALDRANVPARRFIAGPLADDRDLMVRLEAARVLAPVPPEAVGGAERAALESGRSAYRDSQLINADRPDAHANLGWLYVQTGDLDAAERAYRTALRLDATYVPVYINLADLYRLQGRDADGERLVREALATAPESAEAHHALGLLLVRLDRLGEAVAELARAAALADTDPHYQYVYAVGLQTAGDLEGALDVLRRSLQRFPADRELLFGLATFSRDAGDRGAALGYARRLLELNPRDPQAQALVRELAGNR